MRRQMYAGEAQTKGVLHDVEESDDAGPALRGVEPVAGPRIFRDIGFAAIPDVDAVETVVENRDPDEEQLQQKNAGQAVEKFDLLSIGDGTFEGFGIRDEMLDQEGSDGHDAAERMQTAQKERSSAARAEWSDSWFDLGNCGIGS